MSQSADVKIGRLLVPREVGVCGSSKGLSEGAAEFCGALGRRLALESSVVIVSGGTKKRANTSEGDCAVDWHVVTAARAELGDENIVSRRIVTVVREDTSDTTSFAIGQKRQARGKTGHARRISFVRDLDALIAVGGRGGTEQELALAIEYHIPVLPVPTFIEKTRPGVFQARDYWNLYRDELIRDLGIDEERASRWEQQPPPTKPQSLRELADDMVAALLRSLPRRCFIIMPYEATFDDLYCRVILSAVRSVGDLPLRVDRIGTAGDVIHQINAGIRNCDYAVAVLDKLRPNVLYELGLAHAWGKQTILIYREGSLGSEGMAFDIITKRRLPYNDLSDEFRKKLEREILSLDTTRPANKWAVRRTPLLDN